MTSWATHWGRADKWKAVPVFSAFQGFDVAFFRLTMKWSNFFLFSFSFSSSGRQKSAHQVSTLSCWFQAIICDGRSAHLKSCSAWLRKEVFSSDHFWAELVLDIFITSNHMQHDLLQELQTPLLILFYFQGEEQALQVPNAEEWCMPVCVPHLPHHTFRNHKGK